MHGNGDNSGLANDAVGTATTAGVAARHQETMEQLNRTISQAEDLLRALGNESGEAIDAMRARVNSTIRDTRARLAGHTAQARTLANDTMSQADAFVHANPWRAVAIGAGVGMLLAILLSNSRRGGVSDLDLT